MGHAEKSAKCYRCQTQVLARKQTPNHILHLLLTFLLCGTWLIVWGIVVLANIGASYRCTRCGTALALLLSVLLLTGCNRVMTKAQIHTASFQEVCAAYANSEHAVGTGEYGSTENYRAELFAEAKRHLTKEELDAVEKHEIYQGMRSGALLFSWGPPIGIMDRNSSPLGEHECWQYQGQTYVTLYNHRVSWWNVDRR